MCARVTSQVLGCDGKTPVPLPAEVLSAEQIGTYFEAVRKGTGLDVAARQIGMTGTRMRRLAKRDPEFQARLDEALVDARAEYRDELRAEARVRTKVSDRILEVELGTHVPEYDHLRRDKVKIDARVEHAIVIPPEALDALDTEKLVLLRDLLAELGGDIIDGDARELGPGE